MQVLDRYGVKYFTGRSGWQSIRCPNTWGHARQDLTPSARANLTVGMFACMGCQLKGDGYSILMQIEGVGFPEAKTILGTVVDTAESEYLL